jgi:hypothetical protein
MKEGGGLADLTKGYVPVAMLIMFIIPTILGLGLYFGKRDASGDSIASQITSLTSQVSNLQTQVTQIQLAVAKGPTLPENIAFKADLLRLCLENRQLKCPAF